MKVHFALCCSLALAASVVAAAAPQAPAPSDQMVLVDLERDWKQASYSKILAFIRSILADEFVATYDDGSRGDKAKELALTAEFNQAVQSVSQDDFVVHVYGNTAVVWFTLRMTGLKQGQP